MKQISSVLLLLFVACGGESSSQLPAGDSTVFVVATDFLSSSVASRLELPSLDVEANTVAGVGSTDPAVRYHAGRLYVINRFGFDNVTVLDPATREVLGQYSTGPGSNPQDILVRGDIIYVATLQGSGLVAIDTGEQFPVPEPIDLSALDPVDGEPNCHGIAGVGNLAVVSCAQRDDADEFLSPRGPGRIALVDLVSETIVDSADLSFESPVGPLFETAGIDEAGDFAVATFPDPFDATAGCLELISVDALNSQITADGCFLTNEDLGGVVSRLFRDGESFVVSVLEGYDPVTFEPMGRVERRTAATTGTVTRISDPSVQAVDVVRCPTGELVVADAAGGLRVYSDDLEQEGGPFDVGAPPVAGALVCYSVGATQ